jgi:hypothetical protein
MDSAYEPHRTEREVTGDSGAHGRAVNITEAEAYQSLVLLLRFARWADDRWLEITGS